jgi:hypothetical protein
MPIDARCVHAVPLTSVEPMVSGAPRRAWCGTWGSSGRRMMPPGGMSSMGQAAREPLKGWLEVLHHKGRGIHSATGTPGEGVQLFRPRRAHRAMRELLCLPSALEAPRYGQLTRSVTRQACDKPAPLASAKSAVTAPIPATVPPPPGVDNDLPYLSLRTEGRSGRDGSRWPFHGRATPAIMAGTRHLVLVHGRSMTRPEPDCPSGQCCQPPGSDAIQGVVSGGLIASWCRT